MSYIKNKISILAICACLSSPGILGWAQDPSIQLKGFVIDEFGKPISGALLKSENGKCGYLTKVDGAYEIDIRMEANILQFHISVMMIKKYLS